MTLDEQTIFIGPPHRARSKDEIASAAAEKIATTPAMSQEFIWAIIMDALNEAADIARYSADTMKDVLA